LLTAQHAVGSTSLETLGTLDTN